MNKWAPLAPSKPAAPGPGLLGFGSVLKPSKANSAAERARAGRAGPRVGRWPEDLVARIAGYLPVHDLPAFARANRALARLARDERAWKARCRELGITEAGEHFGFAVSWAD